MPKLNSFKIWSIDTHFFKANVLLFDPSKRIRYNIAKGENKCS